MPKLYVVFLLGSVSSLVLSKSHDSCIGRCDRGASKAYNCNCNSVCARYDDCSGDYAAVCLGGQSTVNPLSAVMQDLWNSDASRLRDSDYTISTTGKRLFIYLNETTLNKPTYQGFMRLVDNYNRVVGQAEHLTTAELAEFDDFMNTILATSIMSKTFTFLKDNGNKFFIIDWQ